MEIRARLDKNESPVDVPDGVRHRMIELGQMTEFSRYEGRYRNDLVDALSRANEVSTGNIMLTNGADEAILVVGLAFGAPGVSVIIPTPSFITYPDAARWSHSDTVLVPRLAPDFRMDVDKMVHEAALAHRRNLNRQYSSIAFVCRPNNPTGNLCDEQEVKRLLDVPGCLVVVDEAYFEFSGVTVVPWIAEYKNLIVLRTFSKAYCIAGMRVGYTIAAPETTEIMDKNRLYYNVNVFSQAVALVALNERPYFTRWALEMKSLCATLQESLSQIPGVHVWPSVTNFVLFSTPVPAMELKAALAERGILVTAYPKEPALANHIRVSAGTREENALFLKELDAIMRSLA